MASAYATSAYVILNIDTAGAPDNVDNRRSNERTSDVTRRRREDDGNDNEIDGNDNTRSMDTDIDIDITSVNDGLRRRESGPRLCIIPPHSCTQESSSLIAMRNPRRVRKRTRAKQVINSVFDKVRRKVYPHSPSLLALPAPTQEQVPADDEDDNPNVARCVICLEAIRIGDEAIRLPCFHVFHSNCVLPYLRSLDYPHCPTCRTGIPHCDLPNLPVWTVESTLTNTQH